MSRAYPPRVDRPRASFGARLRQQMIRRQLFPSLVAPPRIGRFEVDAAVGAGAMGAVFSARDPALGRQVAIKVLQSGAGEASGARLEREARALARVNHPNVVTIYEVGDVDGQPFIAMEFVSGQTLREWGAGKSPAAVLDAYCAAARGLSAVHAAGLVHRDFKPANVLVGEDGVVRVADFGLVRDPVDAPSSAAQAPPADWTGTRTGAVLGTPAYMAPEQIHGGVVGPAADQFAFCAALYEALTGSLPTSHRTGAPLSRHGLPRALLRVLARGMAIEPAARWPDMDALIAALARRVRWRVLVAVLIVIGLGAGAWLALDAPSRDAARRALPPVAPLLASDPTIAVRRLAQSVGAPGWAEDAWAALHRPVSVERIAVPPGLIDRVRPNGDRPLLRRGHEAMRYEAGEWRPLALPAHLVRDLSPDSPSPEAAQAAALAAIDWGAPLPFALANDSTLLFRHGGWLMRWRDDRLEPVAPLMGSRPLSSDATQRLLVRSPGEAVWSVPYDGAAPRPIPGTEEAVTGASSAAHDAILLVDGTVILSPLDGPPQVIGRSQAAQGLRFSPDGRWLLALGAQARVWHVAGDRPPFDPPGRWRAKGEFSADSKRIALARADDALVEFSLATRHARVARGHTAEIRNVTPHPDGWMTAGDDGTLRIWRMSSAAPIGRSPGIWSASRAEALILTAGREGIVGAFDLRGVRSPRIWKHASGARAYQAILSPAGDAVMSGAADGVARIWPFEGGPPVELTGHARWAYALAFSPDGQRVATADQDGVVRLWTRSGALLRRWRGDLANETERVHFLTFADAGRALAWGHRHGPVRWAPVDGPARILSPIHAKVSRAPDGHLVTYGVARSAHWYTAAGERLHAFDLGAPASSVFVAPDSRTLAICTTDRQIHLQTIGGSRRSDRLSGVVEFAAWSPDSAQIALGYPDGVVELMDAATGRRRPLGAHDGPVRGVLWPALDAVVSASLDGQIWRWDPRRDPDVLRARLERATRVCMTPGERRAWLLESAEDAERSAARCQAR